MLFGWAGLLHVDKGCGVKESDNRTLYLTNYNSRGPRVLSAVFCAQDTKPGGWHKQEAGPGHRTSGAPGSRSRNLRNRAASGS